MKSVPRILPLLGVAVGGVLAINALAGARDLPSLVSNAKAFAEEAAKGGKKADKAAKPEAGEAKDAAAAPGPLPPPSIKPQPVCAPTAAELAKEAGLSPAELQVLQNLGARRGELDRRESDIDTQLALLSAAEAKLDAKSRALEGLKADVQNLLSQANGREAAEVDRLVKVFESMKPRDAGPRMVLLDDSVRVPVAAKMKERALAAVLANMPPAEAKKLTEALARRYAAAQTLAANAAAKADQAAAQAGAPAVQQGDAEAKPAVKPVRHARKAAPRKRAPAAATASAEPAKPTAAPAATSPAAPAAAPAAAQAPKAG